jgi:hypothetical protein
MSVYKPGTIATATVRGVEGVRVMWTGGSAAGQWVAERAVAGQPRRLPSYWVDSGEITDIRPLVVLDLDAANPYGIPEVRLSNLLEQLRGKGATRVCLAIADQIEEQTKPPRIPEPGLWGVVSAHINGKQGPQATYKWAHAPWGWEAIGSTQATRKWEDLIDPVLIREGVES